MSQRLLGGKYLGRCQRTRQVQGFRLTQAQYAEGQSLPPHSHARGHFCFVQWGSYEERLGHRSYERGPGSLLYYPPETAHSESHRQDGLHFLIDVDPSICERASTSPVRDIVDLRHDEPLALARELVAVFSEDDKTHSISMEALAFELLWVTSRDGERDRRLRKPPHWLPFAEEVLRESLENPPGLAELADIVDVHPAHLSRTFRRVFGCTIGQRIRELRVRQACLSLRNGRESLAELAQTLGFADQSHFTRSFKELTGWTPSSFRRYCARGDRRRE